jgi:hypothetical protein
MLGAQLAQQVYSPGGDEGSPGSGVELDELCQDAMDLHDDVLQVGVPVALAVRLQIVKKG